MSALKKMLKEEDKVDLTPMIDVTFLLLIYFMVTTMLKQPEAELAIMLPGKPKPGANVKVMPRYKVMIEELGDVYINGGSLIEDGSDIEMKELASLLLHNCRRAACNFETLPVRDPRPDRQQML